MINYLSKPFKWFFKLEAASGLILLIAAILALIISNSNLSELYFATLEKYFFIGINEFGLKLSIHHWINDALMAIFFFFVTLEIKREFLQGGNQCKRVRKTPLSKLTGMKRSLVKR